VKSKEISTYLNRWAICPVSPLRSDLHSGTLYTIDSQLCAVYLRQPRRQKDSRILHTSFSCEGYCNAVCSWAWGIRHRALRHIAGHHGHTSRKRYIIPHTFVPWTALRCSLVQRRKYSLQCGDICSSRRTPCLQKIIKPGST